jgi:hypothetical protein
MRCGIIIKFLPDKPWAHGPVPLNPNCKMKAVLMSLLAEVCIVVASSKFFFKIRCSSMGPEIPVLVVMLNVFGLANLLSYYTNSHKRNTHSPRGHTN